MSRRQAAAGCDGVVFIIPSDDACRAAAAVCTTRDKNLLVTVRRDLFVLFIYKRASSGDNVAASVKQPADSSSSPPQGTYINISSCISFSPFSISRKTNFRLSRTRPRRNGKWFKAKTHTHNNQYISILIRRRGVKRPSAVVSSSEGAAARANAICKRLVVVVSVPYRTLYASPTRLRLVLLNKWKSASSPRPSGL